MSRLLRRTTPVVLAAGCLFAGAAPASAATITTPNACKGEDGQVGNLPLQLTATATQAGRTLNVGSTQPGVEVPDWLKAKLQPAAYAFGLGVHHITLEAWMALAGEGSTDAPQVRSTTGSIRIEVGGLFLPVVTNVTVSLNPLASSSWSAVAEGGTMTVKQAGPGTLSAVPGTTTNPAGSLFIRGTARALGQTITLTFDCQPGSNGAAPDVLNTSLVPGPATPLASASFAAAPAQPDSPTPPSDPAPTPAPSPAPAPAPAPAPSPVPSPTPPSANPAPAPSPVAPNGTPVTKPTVTAAAQVKRAKAVKGLRFRVRGGKAGSTYNGVLKVGNRGGKARGKLDAAGSALITLKLPAAQLKRVKKGTKLTLAINVTTADGEVVKLSRTIVVS